MKKLLGVMIVLSAAVALTMGATGCNKPAATGDKNVTVAGPTGKTTLKQGEDKTVDLTLTRGKDAKNDVELTATVDPADKGLTATLEPAKVPGADKAGKLKLSAKTDAEKREYTVKISGTSKDSAAINSTVTVTVEAK